MREKKSEGQRDLFGGLTEVKRPDPKRRRIPLHEMGLDRFKLENGITTWRHGHMKEPWTAYKSPPGHEGRAPIEVISELAEWLEQNGYMTNAKTECRAVSMLCDSRGIMMPISLWEGE